MLNYQLYSTCLKKDISIFECFNEFSKILMVNYNVIIFKSLKS